MGFCENFGCDLLRFCCLWSSSLFIFTLIQLYSITLSAVSILVILLVVVFSSTSIFAAVSYNFVATVFIIFRVRSLWFSRSHPCDSFAAVFAPAILSLRSSSLCRCDCVCCGLRLFGRVCCDLRRFCLSVEVGFFFNTIFYVVGRSENFVLTKFRSFCCVLLQCGIVALSS